MATAGLHDSELGELQRRLIILRVGLLLVVALLGLQLWYLQIREGPTTAISPRTIGHAPSSWSRLEDLSTIAMGSCWRIMSPASRSTSRWRRSKIATCSSISSAISWG